MASKHAIKQNRKAREAANDRMQRIVDRHVACGFGLGTAICKELVDAYLAGYRRGRGEGKK